MDSRSYRNLRERLRGLGLLAFFLHVRPGVSHSSGTDALLAGRCRNAREGPLLLTEGGHVCPLPVDDATAADAGSWSPWSAHPTCAYPLDESSSKYCLYTYTSFHGGGDISIITTPEIAAEATALLEDPDPQWYRWNEPVAPAYGQDEPYELREIPGKGIGVVATRKIQRGEVILSDAAAVITMLSPPRGILPVHKKVLAQKAYDQLGEETRRLITALSGGERGGVEGIFNDNMFTIALAGWEKHRGLFPKVSRINHDCRPSCYPRFSRRRLQMEAVAYRDIEAGEELSISYAPLGVPTAGRQSFLHRQWGFNCTCYLCTHPEESEASDRNKRRIQEILTLMEDPANQNREALEDFASEMRELIEAEGMLMQIGDFYSTLSRTFYEAGLVEDAARYGEWAVDMLREYIGEDSEQVARARTFLGEVTEIVRGSKGADVSDHGRHG